jgi:nicotinate-nucleotide adenylyltransferase
MGGDSFSNISRWKNHEQLLRHYELIIYQRPGFETKAPEGSKVQVATAPMLDISATFIRDQIRSGRSIRYLVPDPVCDYIKENRYYL